jgi:hypothetical protein
VGFEHLLRRKISALTIVRSVLDLQILHAAPKRYRPRHPVCHAAQHTTPPIPSKFQVVTFVCLCHSTQASNSADLILSTAATSPPQPDPLRYPPLLHPRLFVLLCCMMTRRSSLKTRFGNSGIRFSMSTQPRLKQLNRGDSLGFYHKNFTDQCKPRRGYHTSDTDPMQHYTAWAVESDSYSQYIKYS